MSGNIGSSEWWTDQANKVINAGLNVVQTKLQGVDQTGGYTANETSMTRSSMSYLPYVVGALVVGGIVLILAKR